MKLGVIKLGARISFDSQGTSGGTGETISLIKMMAGGGAEVIAFTKMLKGESDNPIENVFVLQIADWVDEINSMGLDAICVLNGNVNFFGGGEPPEQMLNYRIINSFKGPVFYILCDPELTLKQIWSSVEKKEWSNKYKKNEILITREDIFYVCQPYDLEKFKPYVDKNGIAIRGMSHYPFEQFPCLNSMLPFNESPDVHLSYGGTMRSGKRAKKMVKYYFDHPTDISVEMFGKIEKEDFQEKLIKDIQIFPTFTGPVQYDKMLSKMNQAMAHVVIGDPKYEEIEDMAQRTYESIWSQCITFIDSDLDSIRRVFKDDKELSDFLYVNTKDEVADRLRLVISDIDARRQIIEAQISAINFNAKDYCEKFVTLLSEKCN